MADTQIVIAGYPKSGNTWLTRLVAELIGCPVAGFWREPDNPEIAMEGLERVSPYTCYKSHHGYSTLERDSRSYPMRYLYLVRDPRDIAVSGANFFMLGRPYLWWLKQGLWRLTHRYQHYLCVERWLRHSPLPESLYRDGPKRRLARMVHTLIHGDRRTNFWCVNSWRHQVQPFLDHGCFIVRYEDLLEQPHRECDRILQYLGVERSPEAIERAIAAQSFDNAKARFRQRQDRRRDQFLRRGRSGQGQQLLSPAQLDALESAAAEPMVQLGYLGGGQPAHGRRVSA